MRKWVHVGLPFAGLVICLSAGCAVPQPPGKGKLNLLREKTTKRYYWLYLPEEYMAQRKRGTVRPVHPTTKNGLWPLVVSFHGMKPFDNCLPQAQEWQQESDRYGFVMIAPQLNTSDLLMEFPLRHADHFYVKGDERASVAIIHEVTHSSLPVDKTRVLSTSWSSGGYMAHFMVNRHPELFSCLAVRQSNFSEGMLDRGQIRKYRNYPVGVFWTQHDFAICQSESRKAVTWYRRNGFRDLSWGVFGGLGHERTPQSAAALFAIQCGISPKTPAKFPPIVEAYGRLRHAVRYAMRAVPRSQTRLASATRDEGETASAEELVRTNPPRSRNPGANKRPPVRSQAQVAETTRTPRRVEAAPRNPSTARPSTPVARARTADPAPRRPSPRRESPRKSTAVMASPSERTSPSSPTVSRVPPDSSQRRVWSETRSPAVGGARTPVKAPYSRAVGPISKKETPKRSLPEVTTEPPVVPPPSRESPREATTGGKAPNPAPIAPPLVSRAAPKPEQGTPIRTPAGAKASVGAPTKATPTRSPSRVSTVEFTHPERTTVRLPARSEPIRKTALPAPSLVKPAEPTEDRPPVPARRRSAAGFVAIALSRTIGMSPCQVEFKAVLPASVAKGAYFLWTDNEVPICNGQTGSKILVKPGEHRIEVLVMTADDRELRGGGTVTIYQKTTNRKRPTRPYGK